MCAVLKEASNVCHVASSTWSEERKRRIDCVEEDDDKDDFERGLFLNLGVYK